VLFQVIHDSAYDPSTPRMACIHRHDDSCISLQN
jgi:hypothetical protein